MDQRERSGDRELRTTGDRLLDWRELVERCGRKPTKKRVHALRVATLRIQAEVEDELSEVPRASHEAQAMVRFGKLAEKLRDALGSVRELDVWIGKLEGLRESLSGSAPYVPRSSRETSRQLERLERRLTKKRERAGTKLVGAIEKRRDDLMAAAHDVQKATGGRVNEGDGEQQAPKLLKEFAGIVAEFPVFDEENLHEFRKRIKKIRYVAEIHSVNSVCGRIAEQMKTAQAAIGEWHDWQVLARIASDGKHAKDADALELLSSLAAEAFETAVATCHGVLQRMGDLGQQVEGGSGSMRKGPGRSESMMTVAARKLA